MPVWQEFYVQHQPEGVELVSVAVDFQGAAKARPFVEQARATFPSVVDAENVLGNLFGFKAIPNGLFVDETGIIRYTKFGGFDIRIAEFRDIATRFAQSSDLAELQRKAEAASGFDSAEALAVFQTGIAAYRTGQVESALAAWRQAVALEPDNWIIRKQIWAIEHPEKFYAGEVDFGWQREQIAQGV